MSHTLPHTLSNLHKMGKKRRGFTLVELMIVLSIVGILSALAYPSYLNQIRKTSRKVAMADLMSFAQAMERAYTAQTPYTYVFATPVTTNAGVDAVFGRHVSPENGTAKYTLSATATAAGYELTATPVASSTQSADGTIKLKNDGTRTWGNRTTWQE